MERISPATVIATLALILATAGTGLAAGRYLITSTSQISPRVVRQIERTRLVTGQELPGLYGLGSGQSGESTVPCPRSYIAVGGGFSSSSATLIITRSLPVDNASAWTIHMTNTGSKFQSFTVTAVCAKTVR